MPTSDIKKGGVSREFFHYPPLDLAKRLLGKVLRHRYTHPGLGNIWLSARIIETEAYEMSEKGSHSSLGYTRKRAGLFMAPGTIYMYFARGRDSLNFSAQGRGNGVLIKSAYPHVDDASPASSLAVMQSLNPSSSGSRSCNDLCRGQTLLCRALGLRVADWDQRTLTTDEFLLSDTGYQVRRIIQCRRLGIPEGRDEHLPYRFVDYDEAKRCTSNPMTKRGWVEGRDYWLV